MYFWDMSDFAYSYNHPSNLATDAHGSSLLLSAFSEDSPTSAATCFFWGRLCNSWLVARGVSTLAKVVSSRFVPQSAALRDPIITAGAGQLRFEASSSCKGVYARLDLGSEALDGQFLSSGTTDVDFDEPMVNALVFGGLKIMAHYNHASRHSQFCHHLPLRYCFSTKSFLVVRYRFASNSALVFSTPDKSMGSRVLVPLRTRIDDFAFSYADGQY